MENFNPHKQVEFSAKKTVEASVPVISETEEQDAVWAELQQYGAKEVPVDKEIVSVEELANLPEGESLAALRQEAVRGLKNLERIQATGGIEKYLDATEESWQAKRDAMEAQSSRKIEELGGVVGSVKRLLSQNRRNVWVTAQEIGRAIGLVDTYRAKKKQLLTAVKS